MRRYYAERIFAQTWARPDAFLPNFTPLGVRADRAGAAVEGCRGGGKNILEVSARRATERS